MVRNCIFDGFHPDHALSLGSVCAVASQLQSLTQIFRPSPFDWLVTPLSAVFKVLEDGGKRFGSEIAVINGGTMAKGRSYGVLLHHEFQRDDEDMVILSAEALAQCRQKLLHKMDSFEQICAPGGHVLFVRFGGHFVTGVPSPYIKDDRPLKHSEINALVAALGESYPYLSYRLLVTGYDELIRIEGDEMLSKFAAVDLMPLPNPPNIIEWMGKPDAWRSVLDPICVPIES